MQFSNTPAYERARCFWMEQRTMIIVTVVLAVVVAFLTLAIFAGLYLTGGETYQIPVASTQLSANVEIQESDLEVREVEEEPAADVVTEAGQLVGKVTANAKSPGESFSRADVRDSYNIVRVTESVPAGNRLTADHVELVSTQDAPPNALGAIGSVEGKMVRQGIPRNAVVQEEDLYHSEEEIVVVTDTIEANSMIRENQVRVVSRPDVPPDAVTDPGDVIGRSTRGKLRSGQVVRSTDLFPDRQQLSYFIPLYRRAVTIPVSNYNNVSYQLRPGDRVDLYVYLPQGYVRGQSQGSVDELDSDMLQKVADGAEIIGLNDVFTQNEINQIQAGDTATNTQAQQFTYQEMTIGVDLWEAEKIHLIRGQQEAGQNNLRFFVILRPRQLESQYGSRSVSNYDLFNKSLGNEQARNASGPRIQVIQGNQKESYRVPQYR